MLKKVTLNWQRYVKIWWCITWRSIIGGVLAGGITGFLIAFVATLFGVDQASISLAVQVAGAGVGMVVGFIMIRSALKKEYSDFRIVLVSLPDTADSGA